MTAAPPLTFGDIDDTTLPLAVLVHGFPDTPNTWRHLGPDLAGRGYRVVAPWLPGYDAPTNKPISVGTYVRSVLDARGTYRADERAVLIGHDWGAVGVVRSRCHRTRGILSPRHPGRSAGGCAGAGCSATPNSSGRSTSGSSSRSGSQRRCCWSPDSGSLCGRTGRRDTTPVKMSRSCGGMCPRTTSRMSSPLIGHPSTRISPTLPPKPKRWRHCKIRRYPRCISMAPTTGRLASTFWVSRPNTYPLRDRRSKSSTASAISCIWNSLS